MKNEESRLAIELIQEMLNKEIDVCLIPQGGSMRPYINSGEKIRFKRIDPQKIKTGDIIVYKSKEPFLVVHRVIYKKKDRVGLKFITKGDNVWCCDSPVSEKLVLGIVYRVEKGNAAVRIDSKIQRILNYPLAVCSRGISWLNSTVVSRAHPYISTRQDPLLAFGRKIIHKAFYHLRISILKLRGINP